MSKRTFYIRLHRSNGAKCVKIFANKQHAEQLAEKAGIALKEIEIGDIQGNGKLDIVFSFDTTHSMTAYLNQVRDNLKDITKTLFDEIPNIRIGIIAHGDYESPRFPLKGNDKVNHYVIKHLDLTNSYEEILAFLEGCNETGGIQADNRRRPCPPRGPALLETLRPERSRDRRR